MRPLDPTILAHVPLFTGVAPTVHADVLSHARLRVVPAAGHYFHESDPATHFYVLTEGRLKITQLTPEGHQVIHMILSAGEPFGGVAALGEGTYPITAEAVEDCVALSWDAKAMEGLMKKYPDIAINTARFLARRFHELQVQHRQLMTERVERRVARALLKLAESSGRKVELGVEIDFPLSRQDLAEMTGTTLFTVSRLLASWDEQQIITAGRQRVTIRNSDRLLAIAEA
ncbi:MAG: Crp/Fnr family transcriptional regulator [Acidobacteria bacterium]|nr:Crp/Fnr family transcriptional regulator [Acidobacteriota bacterium]